MKITGSIWLLIFLLAASGSAAELTPPRLMIVVSSAKGTVGEAERSARSTLERVFTREGFTLIDPAASEQIHQDTKLLISVTKDTVIAAKLGLDHHAEMILQAVVSSEFLGKDELFENARTTLRLRAIDPSTAKVILSVEKGTNGVGESKEDALAASARRAAELVAVQGSREVLSWWEKYKKEGGIYKITLEGISEYSIAQAFEEVIQAIAGVQRVDERVFAGGFLEVEISYGGNRADLQKGILQAFSRKEGFDGLRIKMVRGNQIVFSLRPTTAPKE